MMPLLIRKSPFYPKPIPEKRNDRRIKKGLTSWTYLKRGGGIRFDLTQTNNNDFADVRSQTGEMADNS